MMPSPPHQSPTSAEMAEPMDTSVDESYQSLELAMKAADAIRKTLQQSDDPLERSLWVPPGTVPGLSAFFASALLLSPLRNAILTRTRTARSVTTNAIKRTATPSSETAPPSFQHLMDLIITPAMAVIAAQIGLVVGTLYGSSHYLQRVVDYDNSQVTMISSEDLDSCGNARDVIDHTNNHSLCQSLLFLTDASNTKFCHNDDKSHDNSVDPVLSKGEYFNAERPISIPSLYPSWDPRQTTIESLYRAIEHCQKHRKGVS